MIMVTSTRAAMCHRIVGVFEEALAAVVAEAAGRVVLAVDAKATALAAACQVELLAEATLVRMAVAVAC